MMRTNRACALGPSLTLWNVEKFPNHPFRCRRGRTRVSASRLPMILIKDRVPVVWFCWVFACNLNGHFARNMRNRWLNLIFERPNLISPCMDLAFANAHNQVEIHIVCMYPGRVPSSRAHVYQISHSYIICQYVQHIGFTHTHTYTHKTRADIAWQWSTCTMKEKTTSHSIAHTHALASQSHVRTSIMRIHQRVRATAPRRTQWIGMHNVHKRAIYPAAFRIRLDINSIWTNLGDY